MSSIILGTKSSVSFLKVINLLIIELRASELRTRKLRSSNSSLINCIPILPANGAKISIVSLDFLICLSIGNALMVLILCNLSASLTSKTLTSLLIAMNSFLKFSACFVSNELSSKLVSFVTPSTS